MSFDPTTFSSATDESDLSDEQLELIRKHGRHQTARMLAQRELERRTTQRHVIAAFDKVYLPLRHKVGPDDDLELSLRGDDVHALLYLCELGLISAGVDPDSGANLKGRSHARP